MTTPVAVVIQYSVPLSQKMFTKTPISWPTRAMKRKLPQLVRSAFVVYPHSRQRAEHPRRDEQRREDRLRGERGEDERQRQSGQRRVGDEDEGRLDQVHVPDERHEGADEQELDDERDEDDRAAVSLEERVQRGLAAADQVGDEAGDPEPDAHPRERAPEVGALFSGGSDRLGGARSHRIASSPSVSPGGRVGSFSRASRTPGTNASREVVSCRIVSTWPRPPRSTSWWATRPGRRTEWIGGSPGRSAAVAFAVPEGASRFVSAGSSTISARGRGRAAP